jgi:RimJ/RimL family protein N-acetyltransferase
MPDFWCRGLAKEGVRELVRHGFEELGLVRISAETMAVNAASGTTMAAAGLRHVRKFHVFCEDPILATEEGEVEYAVTREEWLATQ